MNRVLSFQRVIDSDHPGEEQLDAGERTQSRETAHPRTARSPRDRDCRRFGLRQNAADPKHEPAASRRIHPERDETARLHFESTLSTFNA